MKLFGNRRRAAHTKKSALSRGTRPALIAAVIVLAVAGSAFAAWKLLVKPVERPALSEPEPEPPAEEEAPEPSAVPVTPRTRTRSRFCLSRAIPRSRPGAGDL